MADHLLDYEQLFSTLPFLNEDDKKSLAPNSYLTSAVIWRVMDGRGMFATSLGAILLNPDFLSTLYITLSSPDGVDTASSIVRSAPAATVDASLPVLMPYCVGNLTAGQAIDGTHWVLVVLYRHTCHWSVFNSLSGCAPKHADVQHLMDFCIKIWGTGTYTPGPLTFRDTQAFQQRDMSSCGIHVIENASVLLQQNATTTDLTHVVFDPSERRACFQAYLFSVPSAPEATAAVGVIQSGVSSGTQTSTQSIIDPQPSAAGNTLGTALPDRQNEQSGVLNEGHSRAGIHVRPNSNFGISDSIYNPLNFGVNRQAQRQPSPTATWPPNQVIQPSQPSQHIPYTNPNSANQYLGHTYQTYRDPVPVISEDVDDDDDESMDLDDD